MTLTKAFKEYTEALKITEKAKIAENLIAEIAEHFLKHENKGHTPLNEEEKELIRNTQDTVETLRDMLEVYTISQKLDVIIRGTTVPTQRNKVEAIYGLLNCEIPNILNDQSTSVILEEMTGLIESFQTSENSAWYGWQEEFHDDDQRYRE